MYTFLQLIRDVNENLGRNITKNIAETQFSPSQMQTALLLSIKRYNASALEALITALPSEKSREIQNVVKQALIELTKSVVVKPGDIILSPTFKDWSQYTRITKLCSNPNCLPSHYPELLESALKYNDNEVIIRIIREFPKEITPESQKICDKMAMILVKKKYFGLLSRLLDGRTLTPQGFENTAKYAIKKLDCQSLPSCFKIVFKSLKNTGKITPEIQQALGEILIALASRKKLTPYRKYPYLAKGHPSSTKNYGEKAISTLIKELCEQNTFPSRIYAKTITKAVNNKHFDTISVLFNALAQSNNKPSDIIGETLVFILNKRLHEITTILRGLAKESLKHCKCEHYKSALIILINHTNQAAYKHFAKIDRPDNFQRLNDHKLMQQAEKNFRDNYYELNLGSFFDKSKEQNPSSDSKNYKKAKGKGKGKGKNPNAVEEIEETEMNSLT